MTAAQFRKLRRGVGLDSQQATAKFLHRSLRTIHGWENGEPIDQLVIDYLQLVVKTKSKTVEAREQ